MHSCLHSVQEPNRLEKKKPRRFTVNWSATPDMNPTLQNRSVHMHPNTSHWIASIINLTPLMSCSRRPDELLKSYLDRLVCLLLSLLSVFSGQSRVEWPFGLSVKTIFKYFVYTTAKVTHTHTHAHGLQKSSSGTLGYSSLRVCCYTSNYRIISSLHKASRVASSDYTHSFSLTHHCKYCSSLGCNIGLI